MEPYRHLPQTGKILVDSRTVYAGLGESDNAMDCLERAVAERTGPAYAIKSSFLLTSLYDHPRFRALLSEMKLD